MTGHQDCMSFCSQGETDRTEAIVCKHGEKCIPTCKAGYHNTKAEAVCNNGTFSAPVTCVRPCSEPAITGASQGVTCNSKDSADDTAPDDACLPTCESGRTRLGEAYCFDGTLTSTAACERQCQRSIPNNAVKGELSRNYG